MVEINNQTDFDLPVSELKNLAENILTERGSNQSLSVAFLPAREIASFNERYRNKTGATDVLSFKVEDPVLGEILICPEIVLSQAERFDLSFDREIRRVLFHGILHLLGYDHKKEEEKKKMRKMEEDYLSC